MNNPTAKSHKVISVLCLNPCPYLGIQRVWINTKLGGKWICIINKSIMMGVILIGPRRGILPRNVPLWGHTELCGQMTLVSIIHVRFGRQRGPCTEALTSVCGP